MIAGNREIKLLQMGGDREMEEIGEREEKEMKEELSCALCTDQLPMRNVTAMHCKYGLKKANIF